MIVIRCPFCEAVVTAVIPPLALSALAIHFAENATNETHTWPMMGSTPLWVVSHRQAMGVGTPIVWSETNSFDREGI
jgi:hypothetical protein